MRVLSLFSGIGGMDLGLERAGMTVVAHSEIDPYACRVLRKHWPDVPNLGDIEKITEADLERIGPIDLVCGGFPCTDLSVAGKQAGIHAAKSGLFFDLMRVVDLVGPRYVLLENVPALLARADWMGAVLGALAESGFYAQWDCIPASAVGAPHIRDRVFVIGRRSAATLEGTGGQRRFLADTDEDRQRSDQDESEGQAERQEFSEVGGGGEKVAHAAGEQGRRIQQRGLPADAGADGEDVADADRTGSYRTERSGECGKDHGSADGCSIVADPIGQGWIPRRGDRQVGTAQPDQGKAGDQPSPASVDRCSANNQQGRNTSRATWEVEPGMGRGPDGLSPWVHPTRRLDAWGQGWEAGIPRVAEGVKDRVGRLRALGNAVVPQVAEHVGRIIMDRR